MKIFFVFRFELSVGSYVIIPATFEPNISSRFVFLILSLNLKETKKYCLNDIFHNCFATLNFITIFFNLKIFQ